MKRCGAGHPMYGQIRCEEPAGHTGDHFHSLFMRSWRSWPSNETAAEREARHAREAAAVVLQAAREPMSPFVRRARAGELPGKVLR